MVAEWNRLIGCLIIEQYALVMAGVLQSLTEVAKRKDFAISQKGIKHEMGTLRMVKEKEKMNGERPGGCFSLDQKPGSGKSILRFAIR